MRECKNVVATRLLAALHNYRTGHLHCFLCISEDYWFALMSYTNLRRVEQGIGGLRLSQKTLNQAKFFAARLHSDCEVRI